MSTIIQPVGSPVGRPGADRGSHRLFDQVRVAGAGESVASSTARFSTFVTPEGTHTTTRGCTKRLWCTFLMKWRSICSHTSKSAMTPSLSGRMAVIDAGRAAEHALGLDADGVHLAGALVDGDHRRLAEHDAAASHVDEGVGGAEVDRDVSGAEAIETEHSPTSIKNRSRAGGEF